MWRGLTGEGVDRLDENNLQASLYKRREAIIMVRRLGPTIATPVTTRSNVSVGNPVVLLSGRAGSDTG